MLPNRRALSGFLRRGRTILFPAGPLLAGLMLWPALASGQSPVATGAPLTGEVVLNRDVEVRAGPSQEARILRTLQGGKPLNALDTPRGTGWTLVAIGGQPIGYVPADALDPALLVRPPPEKPGNRR